MSDVNPIQYTSRTYTTILNDINAVPELADKPDWWKRIWAGVGDTISLLLNASVNDNFLRTAFTRQSVVDLAQLIDYTLTAQTTSSGTLIFNVDDNTTFPLSVDVADLAATSTGTIRSSALRFEGRSAVNFTPANVIFTSDFTTDTLTLASGSLTFGAKFRVVTGGTPPAPLQTGVSYFAIPQTTAGEFRVATSLENARNNVFVTLTDNGTGSFEMRPYHFSIQAYQQETRAQYNAGRSDGTTEWQEFNLDDLNIILDSETIIINSVTWSRVDTFVLSDSTDNHYRLLYNSDNSAFLQFGNGTYGAIPGAFDIFASYAFGGGDNSNIASANRIITYAGSNSDIEDVYNPEAMTGGGNPETIASVKRLAPLLLKVRDRFVTTLDGETLALNFGGLSQVKVNKNVYGLLSVQIVGIASGGGNPSSALQSSITSFLNDRTILESIDIRFEDAVISSQNVTCQVKVLSGFSFTQVQLYVDLGWKLFFTETGVQIRDDFTSNGVESATTLINTIFSTSFTSSDYAQITVFLEEMVEGGQAPRIFGEDVQESDAFAFVAGSVTGLDYMTITAPTFPIAITDNEITTDGTITITEIP